MDGQGRVLLPQLLREKAKLMSEVVVSGNEGFLKVENHQDYEQGLEPMTMEDNIELSKVGI
jgi:MraZ protein